MISRLLWLALVAGCLDRASVPCVADTDCDLALGGACLANPATGNRWCAYPQPGCTSGMAWSDADVGDGIAGTCLAPMPPVPPDPYAGGYAFVTRRDLNPEIYVMAADGSAQTALTDDPGDDLTPRWSPDGSRLAFVSTRDGAQQVYVMGADGSDVMAVSFGDAVEPVWSPDGASIMFTSARSGTRELYATRLDGSMPTQLTVGGGEAGAWSPDGSRIAFFRDATIVVANADGSGARAITSGVDASPAWDPSGTRIAYSHSIDRFVSDVYVVPADGGASVPVTHATAKAIFPAWSPDGTRIAYVVDADSKFDVWVATSDGGIATLLGDTTVATAPAWTADGGAVVFAAIDDIVEASVVGATVVDLTNHAGQDDSPAPRPR